MLFTFRKYEKINVCSSLRFRDCEDRPRRLKAQFFSILTIAIGIYYIYWIISSTNKEHALVASLFIAAEISCWILFVFSTIGLWRLRFKPEEGIPHAIGGSVDVFIPTYSEPIQYLRMVLRAASHIEYDGSINKYVLDDAGRREVEELAHEFKFTYLSRPISNIQNTNAKAGNLNFGLQRTKGDFILVLDADQIAQPILASRAFHIPAYLDRARSLVKAIRQHEGIMVPGGWIPCAGNWAVSERFIAEFREKRP